MYPTRDESFAEAVSQRLRNDPRKNVYGEGADSLLVKNAYPQLLSSGQHSHSNSHSPRRNNSHWKPIDIKEYRILKKVGSGTYGSVFHAQSKHPDPAKRDVAIKQLASMHSEKQAQDGFHITAIREIKILKSLHHTNIISLHDVICCQDNIMAAHGDKKKCSKAKMQTYMIFEYMHHDLSGLLHNDSVQFNIPHIKYFLCQILNALQYCHDTAHILHRDIKSSNLLVDNRGVLKIADFGLARQYIPPLSASNSGSIAPRHQSVRPQPTPYAGYSLSDAPSLGPSGYPRHYTNRVVTLWYRAPELLLSDQHYTPAVDMWSVGCVFAELLNGRPLFQGKNELEQWCRITEVCGWDARAESTWTGVLRDKDGLMAYLRKKAKPQTRQLRQRLAPVLESKMLNLDEAGFALLESLLTMNPNQRCDARKARDSAWFKREPYPKPPGLEHLSSSHDYEQRQLRKNGGARARQGQGQYGHPQNGTRGGGNGRYVYPGAYGNHGNRGGGGGRMGRQRQMHGHGRERSRSRSRERSRGSASVPAPLAPPIQIQPPMGRNHGNQPMVMKLQMPTTGPSRGGVSAPRRGPMRRHNNYVDPHPTSGANFYKRYKKPDELKGRSRF